MNSYQLNALTSLDGRYSQDLSDVSKFVSETALISYRIRVEAQWLLHLGSEELGLVKLAGREKVYLERLSAGEISETAIKEVKEIEKKTNHDVKAIEYWLKNELTKHDASDRVLSHVHFGCTSEDINNVSYALMLKDIRSLVLIPIIDQLIHQIHSFSVDGAGVAMMARTHGQAASPTTMGKEMGIFCYRLKRQMHRLRSQKILAKFNGAVGNYNAHQAAYPLVDWQATSRAFVEKRLGLDWNPMTTQIESHDGMIEFLQTLQLLNSILIDFSRDMWGYISLGYFSQKTVDAEVGSSTMPHKVNPIYFENAEGNLGIAIALMSHFAEKLPISRWQRDLSDSTVMRSVGASLGHSILAYKNIKKGLDRVSFNAAKMERDLRDAWELLGEAVQSVMRRYGVKDAYERLKTSTRGSLVVTREMIHQAIEDCSEIPRQEKDRLKAMSPLTYLGYAQALAIGKNIE